MKAVETPGDDGHIHIIPTWGPEHTNRREWVGGWADYKVFTHKSPEEFTQ